MNTSNRHTEIHAAALRYIRKEATDELAWRFTTLDGLPKRLARVLRLEAGERPIVSCFSDAQRWTAMTTSRVFGIFQGCHFSCSPLAVKQWRWGDFKNGGRSAMQVATLALANGTHTKVPYETGPAALAAICYERFWRIEYPVLGRLE